MSTNNITSFGQLVRILLMQSKFIFSISFLALVLIGFKYFTSDKTYSIATLLDFEMAGMTINQANLIQEINDVDSQLGKYKSRSKIQKLIESLNLNIFIDDLEVKNNIHFETKNVKAFHELYITFEQDKYHIYDIKNNFIATKKFNEIFTSDAVEFSISNHNLKNNVSYKITFKTIDSITNFYNNKITLNKAQGGRYARTSLVYVRVLTKDIELGKSILNRMNTIFINDQLEHKRKQANSAINFLNLNITNLREIVEGNSNQLNSFLEENKTLNVSAEINNILEDYKKIQSEIFTLDLEIASLNSSYTGSNPLLNNKNLEKNLLNEQKNLIENQIQSLPLLQQEYLKLVGDLEISRSLYASLSKERLDYEILSASIVPEMRVIDSPYYEKLVSPRLVNSFASFVFFVLVAIGIGLIKGIYFSRITNPAEISDNGIDLPILGVFPYIPETKVDIEADDIFFKNALDSFILNIESLNKHTSTKKGKVISITSATPSNGKTFLSINIAKSLAEYGKKVLVVDADYKKSRLTSSLGIQRLKLDRFLDLDANDLSQLKLKQNLYVLPKISTKLDSFEFFYSGSFKTKFNDIKNEFDYLIVDTGPILAVSDTSILNEMSDVNLLTVRHNYSKMVEIKHAVANLNQISISFDGILYNSYSKPQGYLGYYGLYGNYSYQYYANKYIYYGEYLDNEKK